jgi:hypothetical protein
MCPSSSKPFEVVKARLPEAGHLRRLVDKRRQRAGVGAAMGQAAIGAIMDKAPALQLRKMLGYRGQRDPGCRRQGADGLFAVAAEAFEERTSRGIGKRAKDRVRGKRQHTTSWF